MLQGVLLTYLEIVDGGVPVHSRSTGVVEAEPGRGSKRQRHGSQLPGVALVSRQCPDAVPVRPVEFLEMQGADVGTVHVVPEITLGSRQGSDGCLGCLDDECLRRRIFE